jgi:hypothetical protein
MMHMSVKIIHDQWTNLIVVALTLRCDIGYWQHRSERARINIASRGPAPEHTGWGSS